jgi:hypothetical protein
MKFGQDYDILSVIVPVDLAAGANTGHRIHMSKYGSVTFCGYLATGTAAEAPTFTTQEHDAATSGNSQDLDVVATYWQKEEATLDGDETWVEVTQTADAAVTDADWDDANQVMVAWNVSAKDLSTGFEWVSVNIADPGTAHIGCVFAIADDLYVQAAPDSLPQANA